MNDHFHKLAIGTLTLRGNLIAAPMAGLSSLPYRILAMEMGCSLAISEMVSAEGAIRGRNKTRRFFANDKNVRPFGVQLFGAKPDAFTEAIESFEEEPIDLVDINMGCPVRKVCRKGAGTALMKTPKLAAKIIAAVRSATTRPVTVKIRSGWDDKSINCTEIAKIAEDCGADAIAVHPRTRKQEFRGSADWKFIGEVKSVVKIPVIGNGDIGCRDDAIRMIDETGCDGVMIGRKALGNPWIFRKILDANYIGPTLAERGHIAMRHLEMLGKFVGEDHAVMNMKAILPWYTKGIPGVKSFMREAQRKPAYEELRDTIEGFFLNANILNEELRTKNEELQ